MKLNVIITNLNFAAVICLLIACKGERKDGEQTVNLQDEIECVVKSNEDHETERQGDIKTEDPVNDSRHYIIYSEGKHRYYKETDTVLDVYRIRAIKMRSYSPEDLEGPLMDDVMDVYGNYINCSQYFYGSRGKIIINSIDGKQYSDSVYITRELIASKLKLNPRLDVKQLGLGDFEFKCIRNDSIIINTWLEKVDTDETEFFSLKFKKGDRADNFDVEFSDPEKFINYPALYPYEWCRAD